MRHAQVSYRALLAVCHALRRCDLSTLSALTFLALPLTPDVRWMDAPSSVPLLPRNPSAHLPLSPSIVNLRGLGNELRSCVIGSGVSIYVYELSNSTKNHHMTECTISSIKERLMMYILVYLGVYRKDSSVINLCRRNLARLDIVILKTMPNKICIVLLNQTQFEVRIDCCLLVK